jgi:opacity protein-like surface antigen
MKSLILSILILVILLPSLAQAQIFKGYGFKAGAVRASQSFDYTMNLSIPIENRWGLDVGAFAELFQHPNFSLLTELHYIQKGYSLTVPVTSALYPEGTGEYYTYNTRLDYLSVPVLAKVRYAMDAVTPYIIAGPRFDFLLGKYETLSLDYSSTDIGITVGGGVQFSVMPSSQMLVEGRFSPSFAHAFQNPNLTVKNKSFEILVGMSF